MTEWIAHRGYSRVAPENTLAAFDLALKHGADGIEFDVHFTRDRTAVVLHDAAPARTTGLQGLVSDMSFAQLRAADAGSWFAPEFAGEPIPTLDEVLALVAGRARHIYPEIKGYHDTDDLAALLELLSDHGLEEHSTILAFDWGDLLAVRGASRRVHLGFEIDRAELFDPALEAAAADGRAVLSCKADLLIGDATLAQRAAERGVAVAAWTVNEVDAAQALVAMGVRTLMTDDVGLRALL
jgi:glycerophosphoryl diester phosphodiesterase